MNEYREFENNNLRKKDPVYFYRVSEFITSFEADEEKNQPIDHHEDFKGDDFLKCKQEAEEYYMNRLEGLENGKYFLPFAAPGNFQFGKNSAFSIILSIIEYYSEDDQYEHPILGEEDEITEEGKELEESILKPYKI